MSSRLSPRLRFSLQYKSAATVDQEIHVENRLLLKSQLLGPRIRLQVKIRLEEGVGIFGEGVEIKVIVEAKPMQGIFPVKINLVEPVYDVGLSLKKETQGMNLSSGLE